MNEDEVLSAPGESQAANDATGTTGAARSSPRRSTAYDPDAIDAETVVSGCALAGMLFFACLLFASVLDIGVGA